ncbi:MAG TPA: diaminopimelate decarboxylase [Methylomirabilota bacterium]|nr:diaminopimelate decarboxylase [Methylomirabilota bacterium]
MHHFHYQDGQLYCEEVPVLSLAKKHGTPLFIYSQNTFLDHYNKLHDALAPLDHLICYAMKSNSNLAVLSTLAKAGSGFDIVSEGELRRAVAAGGSAEKCVFAGVGKSAQEIEAALRAGIYSFNVESEPEVERINAIAAKIRKVAPIAVRVNPNIDAGTHAKITTGTYENKFGIAFERIEEVYARASKLKNIKLRGLQMHIGSQLTQVDPFRKAVEKVAPLAARLAAAHGIEFFSIGGGLGIIYQDALASGQAKWWKRPEAKDILTPQLYAQTLVPILKPLGLRVLIEPGRFISGNAGILVARVEYVKKTGKKNFVIVDAAMNDLIRPAFYDAYHQIIPVTKKAGATVSSDVVGPICESGDYFAKDRPLPKVGDGDYIALLSAGAYGSVMSSNYNSRPIAAEVLVNGSKASLVRERQSFDDIWRLERVPSWAK